MFTTSDKIKLIAAILLLGAGVYAFYFLANQAMALRVVAVLAAVAVAGAVAWMSSPGKAFVAFAQEAVKETKRVVWPSRKETMQTTGVVVLLVLVMAAFMWTVDAILAWGVKYLLGWGG